MTTRVPVSCNRDCIAGCPLAAIVENGRIKEIVDSRHRSPYARGCPRGYNSHRVLNHPERVTRPLVRRGRRGGTPADAREFEPVSWDSALDLVEKRLREAYDRFGADSIVRIGGSGACRGVVHHTARLTARFLALAGGFTDTTGSFSAQAASFTTPFLYGTPFVGIDVKTLRSSEMVVLWGFNPADTRFGTESEAVLSEVRAAGTPIVVIDPRRTRTVRRYATEWIPVRPGTDTALLLALLYEILEQGIEERSAITRISVGFDELEAYIRGELPGEAAKTPEWAEPLCGVDADTTRRFARDLAKRRPAALLAGLAIQRTLGGEDAVRLAGALQLALGNVGVPGGSAGAGQWYKLPPPRIAEVPAPPNPVRRSLPVYEWAEAILDARSGANPYRIAYNVGGNYAVQGSNVSRNLAALASLDFVVTHDLFLTDTAQMSDVVLPVTTFLERRDVVRTADNHLLLSERAAAPPEEVLDDYAIFALLAARLGFEEEFTCGRTADEWVDACIEESEIADHESFRQTGIYAGAEQERVGLAEFVADPRMHPLATPSGKIEIASAPFAEAGGTRTPTAQLPRAPAAYPLMMVTPHERLRNNSQFDNVEPLSRGIDRTLWIHPGDAAERGITAGATVRVTSPDGTITAPVRITEDIMPGVVSMNQGGWIAASANHLTSTEPTLPSHGARTHSVWVEVKAVTGEV